MEFFERAHVAKRDSSKKESKSDETMKRQLKQMLYGYKKSDNELIMSSASGNNDIDNIEEDFDDSSSVSGFSDLNLTNSTIDDDATRIDEDTSQIEENICQIDGNVSQDVETFPKGHTSESSVVNQRSSCYLEDIPEEDTIDSIDSLSEDNEQNSPITSMSKDGNDSDSPDNSISDNDIFTFADNTDGPSTDMISNESDTEFDADGQLATKIFENLSKKSQEESVKNVKKRKLNNQEKDENNLYSNETTHSKRKETPEISVQDNIHNEYDENSSSHDTISTNVSSPFISVIATDMPEESLNDVLGEYVHPTMKNLPSEKSNIVYSVNNIGNFPTDSMNVDGDQEFEISSLIPELDEEQLIEEIELETDVSTQPLEDSTNYDDTLQSETSEREETTDEPPLPIKMYYANNRCIFVLKHPTELYFHGKVKIKALGGTVEVFGHTLQNKCYDLYAPNYSFAHYIKTLENNSTFYGLFGKLTSCGLSVMETEEIVTSICQNDCVIALSPLSSVKMDFVDNNFSPADLFSKNREGVGSYFRNISEFLGCSLYFTKPKRCFEAKPVWEHVVNFGLDSLSKTVICGGKGVGKSTFLRYYINKLLSRGPVLVIDLDPGQAEFSVAGNVSATVVNEPLLGPNFTHLKTPEKMLNIGMINTMDNPTRYVSAVDDLVSYCCANDQYNAMPWVINTMGMCNNMGHRFIAQAILRVKPTLLYQIDSKNSKKRFDYDLDANAIKKMYYQNATDRFYKNVSSPNELNYLFYVSRQDKNEVGPRSSMTPRDERYLNFLAYFGELLNDTTRSELLEIIPYEVNIRDLNVGMNVRISEESVMKVINGKIIALCKQTQDKGVFTLGDKAAVCLGHGLVRAADITKGLLYIVTPVAIDRLAQVNTLVYADWVPELRGQERHLPAGTAVPYRTATEYQQRQLMFAPRRRFNPLQLLKMSRNT